MKFDFYQIHEEAKRQEEIHPSNKGEQLIAQGIFTFFNETVIPLIISEAWVYEVALDFVENHVQTYFNNIRLSGDQTYKWQQNLLKINNEVIDMLAKLALAGKAPKAGEVNLPKASDFPELISFEKLTQLETQKAIPRGDGCCLRRLTIEPTYSISKHKGAKQVLGDIKI